MVLNLNIPRQCKIIWWFKKNQTGCFAKARETERTPIKYIPNWTRLPVNQDFSFALSRKESINSVVG